MTALAFTGNEPRPAMPASDLAVGLRILADLLSAGLPVMRSLNTLQQISPASWGEILPHMQQAIREGRSLGAALRDAPLEIPSLVVGMTLAGEMSGDVAAAVRRAADVTESIAATRSAVRNALAYPIVLAIAGTGSIALMIGVVIPRFAAILGDLGQSLPLATRVVMSGATAIQGAMLPVTLATVLIVVLWRAWTWSESGRRTWHEALLGIPVIGPIRQSTGTARTSFTLAMLLETGVPLRQAIPLAARASGDAELEARVMDSGRRIESGLAIGSAFRETRAFTPLALQLVQAGEESGQLAAMLRHAAKLEQDRADRVTRTSVRLLEPALILAFAGIVALVAAALLQAVYSVRPTI